MNRTVVLLSLNGAFIAAPQDGDVRLAGGATMNEGRVEVYHDGTWGTVCDDNWGISDANVVCRQLGYSKATSAPGEAAFGIGSGPIHYDNMACSGCEARLADCLHLGIGSHNCRHQEDAGVVCEGVLNLHQLNCLAGVECNKDVCCTIASSGI